ncbi:aminoacyl-tRNA hydrolase [Thermomicrobiaceae bacterium CFH 74404]|uniref:Peptidyl-tRNA hydrolase n=1 Tax=Thermalbibacter longus TaxID=2951981 RepID=A0AA41WC90_9BACT|nr:aminoacyl-tRNA hydrolase [Thermalbibacter longus]MCM8750386.1 aminoacyl-tRNA hydrolase [Thermalbibacter longus]
MSQEITLIAGLGNPGARYARTRHNAGFMVVDVLARRLGVQQWHERFDAQLATCDEAGRRLILLKPMTYMNLSGRSVQQALSWYRVPLDRLLVVYDDVDLPFGTIRIRLGGSSGGHHGVESIIVALGSDRFARLRVGIGRPRDGRDVTAYVLTRFTPEEEERLPGIIERAAEAALTWSREGIVKAMNLFNRADGGGSRALQR